SRVTSASRRTSSALVARALTRCEVSRSRVAALLVLAVMSLHLMLAMTHLQSNAATLLHAEKAPTRRQGPKRSVHRGEDLVRSGGEQSVANAEHGGAAEHEAGGLRGVDDGLGGGQGLGAGVLVLDLGLHVLGGGHRCTPS